MTAARSFASASVYFFIALSAVMFGKAWPANLPGATWPAVTGALAIVGGAAWFWREWLASRVVESAESFSVRPWLAKELPLPEAFACPKLQKELRLQFVKVQAAWDVGEIELLQSLTTPEMLDDLCFSDSDREARSSRQASEVVLLRADLLELQELASVSVLTVEFSGLMREGPDRGADPFREMWILTKSKQNTEGWRLARHQTLL